MKKVILVGTAIAVVVLLVASLSVFAQGGGGRGGGGGARFSTVLADLNLTDAQKTSLGEIAKDHLAKIDPVRQQTMEKRQALLKAVFTGAPEAQVNTLRKDLSALHNQAAEIDARDLVKVSKVFTADQNAKFLESAQNFRGMGGRPGGGRPGGQGGAGGGRPGGQGGAGGGQGGGQFGGPDPVAMALMDMLAL